MGPAWASLPAEGRASAHQQMRGQVQQIPALCVPAASKTRHLPGYISIPQATEMDSRWGGTRGPHKEWGKSVNSNWKSWISFGFEWTIERIRDCIF